MGHKRTYTSEFKLHIVQLLEQGEQNPYQISRDHHVTRSLLYVRWQFYQERGEAAFVPTQAFQSPPEVDRPQNAQERLPIWNANADNRRWNWICYDSFSPVHEAAYAAR